MIINNTAAEIHSNVPSNKTQKMTVKQSGKLFTLLSDNLYSDKIGSIVRELSCNARDSHIEAKNDKPFDIFLPSALDPMFKIKDYGLGMSKDEIINIFSCYGESTKGETNELIGAFGLGSKTPFAYTDSFNITSIHNNKKTSYTIYIDSEGFPAITEMFCIDTIEENGFEIFFGVAENDFRSFKYEVDDQLKYFDFNINIDNVLKESFDINNSKFDNITYEDENCIIKKQSYGNTHIFFGGLMYKSNKDYILDHYSVYLKCAIGDIDVSLSREAISYTQKTLDFMKEKFKIVTENFVEFILKESNKYIFDFDFDHWLYVNFDNKWIIEDIFDRKYNSYKNLSFIKYDKLRFYREGKRIWGADFRKIYPLTFFINDSDPKISAKKSSELYFSYNKIVVLPKIGSSKKDMIDVKIQINQFKMDFDTNEFIHTFTQDDIEEINDVTFETDNKEIKYTCIESGGTFSNLEYIDEDDVSDIKDGDCLFLVKYKNDFIDHTSKENKVLMYNGNLKTVQSLCVGKDIFCFTKQEYNKVKKQDWFVHLNSVKDHIIETVEQYKKDESKYYLTEDEFSYLGVVKRLTSNIDDLEDEILKKHCKDEKIVLKYYLKHFLTTDNFTGIKLDTTNPNKEIDLLDERYRFLSTMNYYHGDYKTEEDKKEFLFILNSIYTRSLT